MNATCYFVAVIVVLLVINNEVEMSPDKKSIKKKEDALTNAAVPSNIKEVIEEGEENAPEFRPHHRSRKSRFKSSNSDSSDDDGSSGPSPPP